METGFIQKQAQHCQEELTTQLLQNKAQWHWSDHLLMWVLTQAMPLLIQ